ncbi:MAG TPA: CocE/NonD family hydrolase, partial [Solirubrobacter sp.]|nr:CocE/NonD family hydrolase [Solirubrobacter sp.]
MTRWARGLAAGVLALAALALSAGAAQAQGGPVLEDGKTKAVYDYKQAVRQRVFIPQPGIDQDGNGQDDWVTADIIRPKEAGPDNKMPAIIDPSPYYTTLCRGNEGECMADWDDDGVNDRWPLFYDNYFVPRGYAYVLGQMNGTGYTESGCPMHGGPGDIAGEKSIVDWLNGRVVGYSAASLTAPQVVADWHNGSSAMIGKSYDGTLSNGVAATGVEGLKAIVPVSGISAWYNYSRSGGIRHNTNYPAYLNGAITTAGGNDNPPGINLPDRHPFCDAINDLISDDANVDNGDGDAHGDINTFWRDRDYVKDAAKVKAAVLISHGLQDDNVRTDQFGMWWDALAANDVPRKMWLLRAGHEDAFDSRRAVWVDTLHRWFDHWLYGVDNGIMNEPKVTIEDSADNFNDYGDWPIPGTENVDVFLRAVDDPAAAGTLGGLEGGGAADTLGFTASLDTSETTRNDANNLIDDPTVAKAKRRVFLSRLLTDDVRLSGTARADIAAALGADQSNLSVVVVDYGESTQVSRSSEGIQNADTRSCWGAPGPDIGAESEVCSGIGDECTEVANEIDDACYRDTVKPTQTVDQFRVTRGTIDSSNRDSLWYLDATPVTIGQQYRFKFPTMPADFVFHAGHRVGIIVAGTNRSMTDDTGNDDVPVTLDARTSKVTLPIVGGYAAAASAGLTDAETVP